MGIQITENKDDVMLSMVVSRHSARRQRRGARAHVQECVYKNLRVCRKAIILMKDVTV